MKRYLFDRSLDKSSCGVGFITHKQSTQTHELISYAHQALCMIPHRGGMNAEGIGDGAGVNIDLSLNFFKKITGNTQLLLGEFGVANFFYPHNIKEHQTADSLIRQTLSKHGLDIIKTRNVDTNEKVLNPASQSAQLAIKQFIFTKPSFINNTDSFEKHLYYVLQDIESHAFSNEALEGLYPLSLSARTQVLKGRLNSWEVIPYFCDLNDEAHQIHTLFFHTRFSTNTAPNPIFAQPFRRMAHNGELNTDKKNRLSEDAIARFQNKEVHFPKGQSDSARLDQTLARRVIEDQLDIDVAALAMMPPAWENDDTLSDDVSSMLSYFSLYEEKNDGPAAFIFGDGTKVGARLDRLGLRPLRSIETTEYLAVMSEAGQIDFPTESILKRGRIEAGGMIVFDHSSKTIKYTNQVLEDIAAKQSYKSLLDKASITLNALDEVDFSQLPSNQSLNIVAQHVAFSMNQESFKFMLDPMLLSGAEKISAMGYGLAPNILSPEEGGVSRYFSQRFAQVTNPPLDSIREADGMTLRVAVGPKPNISPNSHKQIILNSPILQPQDLVKIQHQSTLTVKTLPLLFASDPEGNNHELHLLDALNSIQAQAIKLAKSGVDLIILSDQEVSHQNAAIPALLAVAYINQGLIKEGLRFSTSLICHTGQSASTHDIACLLGFGASAVCPITVFNRAKELFDGPEAIQAALNRYQKACEKALMKTMGKFGLCTVESYIGGEFFEANFIDTSDPILNNIFPNIHSPVGGVRFKDLVQSALNWHKKVYEVQAEDQIPVLGLFKERAQGAGHSFGNTAVREYINMTEEPIQYVDESQLESQDTQVVLPKDNGYKDLGYEARTPDQIDQFKITQAYRDFSQNLYREREYRPAALRDVLTLPTNLNEIENEAAFTNVLLKLNAASTPYIAFSGCHITKTSPLEYTLTLDSPNTYRYLNLTLAIKKVFEGQYHTVNFADTLIYLEVNQGSSLQELLNKVYIAPSAIALSKVQPAHQITACFASGAMSHGALVEQAHEAVAQGTNIAGAMSNSGEGGESSSRYNTVKASKIKQFASGRFGVWTGYLADPCLQEIEIKIGQGAKPGEGGQLPAPKVNVRIAAARGGTPGVELVSPPPHHDTYSIEDLGQLIHDAKAARVRVIVKLVSSEGIGTIAVGVAKAGADVINVAGSTGGTGAAQVTSLKHTGRASDIGIAEVHQALSENGLRDKVTLRCSNAHQTGLDVIKSAILGGDSFEFGTTALMMLKCVMAKNCNLKCPAGLTTNPEVYKGDPRALAQYFMNVAHEVRELLAQLGFESLCAIRGKTELLSLINHPVMIGQLDMSGMLTPAKYIHIEKPTYLEANFSVDDQWLSELDASLNEHSFEQLNSTPIALNNCNKTVGGQLAIDIERKLNYDFSDKMAKQSNAVITLKNGRRVFKPNTIVLKTSGSAGQSYGAFNNSGMAMSHIGTCNDGVGKGASGGSITVISKELHLSENVLVGNFALFGATGGELFVRGAAGDRFGVRNSGAIAVVEGVGDFCCEYMTNGTIINLGVFGKGMGNGMSGGTAYQYDPTGDISNKYSKDSVEILRLSDTSDLLQGQEVALKHHLRSHIRQTQSPLASSLINNWDQVRQHFYILIPKALFQYHCSEHIAHTNERRSMLEELSQAWGEKLLMQAKAAYDTFESSQIPPFEGKIPTYGDRDTELIYQYIVLSGVFHRALETEQKIKRQGQDAVNAAYLINIRDQKLLDCLVKDAKEALASFQDDALSSLLAQKRVQDYKDALAQREVWDTNAMSTSVWIIERDKQIAKELSQHQSITTYLATHYCHILAEAVRSSKDLGE